MPPRTRHTEPEADTTAPTRQLPESAAQLAELIELRVGGNIVTTGLGRRAEQGSAVRAVTDTARNALRFSISQHPENFGHNPTPDFMLAEAASADFSRLSTAIREGQRRARFR